MNRSGGNETTIKEKNLQFAPERIIWESPKMVPEQTNSKYDLLRELTGPGAAKLLELKISQGLTKDQSPMTAIASIYSKKFNG